MFLGLVIVTCMQKSCKRSSCSKSKNLHTVFSNTIVFLYEPFAHCTLRIHSNPLVYTSYGKPNPLVFKNAENVLRGLLHPDRTSPHHVPDQFRTLYMVGDNPKVDIRGARQVHLHYPRISLSLSLVVSINLLYLYCC